MTKIENKSVEECREQIQEDVITYLEGLPSGWVWYGEEAQEKTDALCQIVGGG
jgi:hypothetical protein